MGVRETVSVASVVVPIALDLVEGGVSLELGVEMV